MDDRGRLRNRSSQFLMVVAVTLIVATGCRGKTPPPAVPTPVVGAPVATAGPVAQPEPTVLTDPVVLHRPDAEPLPAPAKLSKKKIGSALKQAKLALDAGHIDERQMSADALADTGSSDSSTARPVKSGVQADALGLYRGVLATEPKNAAALQGLDAVIAALLTRANAALTRGDIVNAQRDGDRIALLRADNSDLPALNLALDKGWHVAGLVERGQRLELQGALISPRSANAAAAYRQALASSPTSSAAEVGLERLENRYINKAIVEANAARYVQSERLLTQAASVRPDSPALKAGKARIAAIRTRHAMLLAAQANMAAASGDPDRAERLLKDIELTAPKSPLAQQVRKRIEIARNYGRFMPGEVFTDPMASTKERSPEMIVVPIGSFEMGSLNDETDHDPTESPQRQIEFKHGFAMSRTEITVQQFAQFVQATHYRTQAERVGYSMVYDEAKGKFDSRTGVDWHDDYAGQPAGPEQPVMHVSWNDSQAYTIWLSKETSQLYRLPSEAEFEYGLRSGSKTPNPWPDTQPPANIGNLAGNESSPSGRHWGAAFAAYHDPFWGAAPVAHFAANTFGLYDMVGNLSEWTLDCWHDSYRRAPQNGSAWVNPGCGERVVRGSSWSASPDQSRSAHRMATDADATSARVGFRIVREI